MESKRLITGIISMSGSPFGMDVSGLVNGVYFIRLEDQDGVMEQRRFIKAQ
jgi:hypothetical protein